LVAVASVIFLALLANRATAVGFRQYLNQDQAAQWSDLQAQLAQIYGRQGNWDGIETYLVAAGPTPGQGEGSLTLLDSAGQVVAIAGGRRNAPMTIAEADTHLPILVGDQQVGTLLFNQPGGAGSGAGEQFLAVVNRAIWWGGILAVLLALFLGVFFARQLTKPLRKLTAATRKVGRGELGEEVQSNSQGELGELTYSFNQMSVTLAAYEQQRQQMLADIAHELRTPISIMRGHIEAMLDGVFPMTSDNLAVVHEETLLLGRLVDDLRVLSLADAGQLTLKLAKTDLAELISQSLAAFEPLAEAEGIELTAETPGFPVIVTADPGRIRQVLGNLLANALHHVRANGQNHPQVKVCLWEQEKEVVMSVSDNGPGLTAAAQKHIFDRFWRADNARNRDHGGSGLGLAICQAIVEAHGGRIWVDSVPGRHTTFTIELPVPTI
jgi:signal transduction histidine kinase